VALRVARWVLALAALWAAASLVRTFLERRPAPAAAKKTPAAAGVPPELATRELKILHFYAPRIPERGKPATICYGVVNATRVELDPPLEPITPSINRCVEIVLRKDTQLTLRAYGRDGRTVTASFRLPVAEARPEILFVDVSPRQLSRGDRFTLCYGVRFATRVRVEPDDVPLAVSEKNCATWFPLQAPERLVVEGPGGAVAVSLGVRMETSPPAR
jgi:hypothetical protein